MNLLDGSMVPECAGGECLLLRKAFPSLKFGL